MVLSIILFLDSFFVITQRFKINGGLV